MSGTALAHPVVAAPSSYDELFRRDGPYIGKLVRKYLGSGASPEDVEDVMQYIAEKIFSRGVLEMYDGSHASNARWYTFLTRQVELYCRGQRQAMQVHAWREPAKCDAPVSVAGAPGTTWAELYGGVVSDDYPSLGDGELVSRLRAYLESAPPWSGPVSLVALFDVLVRHVTDGYQLTPRALAASLGCPPASVKLGLALLQRRLAEAWAPFQPVFEVGGVEQVTPEEITAAVTALESKKSTAVKQVLFRAESRLAYMDYHAVAEAEIKAFPWLDLPSGTRQAHHGRVKGAVLHHLRRLLESW